MEEVLIEEIVDAFDIAVRVPELSGLMRALVVENGWLLRKGSMWKIKFSGLGREYVALGVEELPGVLGLNLEMETGEYPVLTLRICPELMDVELRDALVKLEEESCP